MGNLFGTDGVRGIANKELKGDLAYKLGRAGGYYLTHNYEGTGKPVMILGKDTRISGDMLEAALVAGLTSVGIDVIKVGIIPTPGIAYLSSKLDVEGGIMISASHNPIADNGIKFFSSEGYKLTDEMENEIEELIFNTYGEIPYPTHEKIGVVENREELKNNYVEYLVNTVKNDFNGLKIILDCANGAAYQVGPEVLKRLGADLITINDEANGEKINVNCGSTNPEVVRRMVIEESADLGIAYDGDADRVILVDEKGQLVDGDNIMAILALDLIQRGKLKNKTLVTTAYSNLGLKEVIEKEGGQIVVTANGDRYVLKEMLTNNYNLGGEKSGHIILLDYNKTGDGVLTGIQVVDTVKRQGKRLSELAGVLKPWPQKLVNVKVKYKNKWKENKRIKNSIIEAEKELGDGGRVFVRASGTEPVIRIMLEGKDEAILSRLGEKLAEVVKEELND